MTTALLLSRNPKNHVSIVAKHMPGDYDVEYASPWAGANYMPSVTSLLFRYVNFILKINCAYKNIQNVAYLFVAPKLPNGTGTLGRNWIIWQSMSQSREYITRVILPPKRRYRIFFLRLNYDRNGDICSQSGYQRYHHGEMVCRTIVYKTLVP